MSGTKQPGEAAVGRVEPRTIYQIPLNERHGTAASLFTLWFGANIMILTVVTGALSVVVFHLDFVGAVAGLIVGNFVGAVFMALHAAQGPQLGVPQMVQSRGQFGSIGALFVVILVIVMYSGFVASNLVLGGQSLRAVWSNVSLDDGIVLIGVVSFAAAVYGHDLIHAYARLMCLVAGAALVLAFVWIIFVHGLPDDFSSRGSLSLNGIAATVSIAALWQIAYAPYVSDYSRYLPVDTGPSGAFWASYWGCALGSIFPMILGALIGLCVADGDVVAGLASLTGAAAVPIVVIFSIGIASATAVNIYCCALCAITVGQTLLPRWNARASSRIVLSIVISLASLFLALWGADGFIEKYTNFIDLLLYVMVPWTAVNLVDYYLVQHGDYDVDAFFRADGGIYGRYNLPALACYGLGIVIQVPFIATDLYTGPIAAAWGGLDISWLVGLAAVSPIYYVLARRFNGHAAVAT